MELRIAITETPTSAKTASHMLAMPKAPEYQDQSALTARAKTIFWRTMRQGLSGNAYDGGNLGDIVVHQNHVCRLDGRIGTHTSHGDADIGTGYDTGASLIPSPTKASALFVTSLCPEALPP